MLAVSDMPVDANQVAELEDEKLRREENDRTAFSRKEQYELQIRSLQAQVSILENENKVALQAIGQLEQESRNLKQNRSTADIRVGELEVQLASKNEKVIQLEKK